jgi:hypothetical protein
MNTNAQFHNFPSRYHIMTESPYGYELTFEQRDGYLSARVTCPAITLDLALAYMTRIAEKSVELGGDRVLIHRDIPVSLPDGAVFVVVERFVELIGNRTRSAVVNEYPANEPSLEFGALVAENRGAQLKVFESIRDAEEWLLK